MEAIEKKLKKIAAYKISGWLIGLAVMIALLYYDRGRQCYYFYIIFSISWATFSMLKTIPRDCFQNEESPYLRKKEQLYTGIIYLTMWLYVAVPLLIEVFIYKDVNLNHISIYVGVVIMCSFVSVFINNLEYISEDLRILKEEDQTQSDT